MAANHPRPIHRVQSDEQEIVIEDAGCIGCGYNLRGLLIRGRCPECGLSVGRSVEGDLLRHANPHWLANLSRGLQLLVYSLFAPILVGMGAAALDVMFVDLTSAQVMGAASTAGACLRCAGTWWLTSREPGRIGAEPSWSLRRACRLIAAMAVPVVVLGVVMPFNTRDARIGHDLVVIGLQTALLVTLLLHLRGLAKRVPDAILARQTLLLMLCLVPAYLVLRLAIIGRDVGVFAASGAMANMPLTTSIGLVSVCGLLLLLVAFNYWMEFASAVHFAREATEMALADKSPFDASASPEVNSPT